MTEVIRKIQELLWHSGNDNTVQISITPTTLWFEINDIYIIVDQKAKSVYVDGETTNSKIDLDTLRELYLIVDLLQQNMETLSQFENNRNFEF